MACTVSNRETFTVLEWMEADPVRREWWKAQAERFAKLERISAIPRLSNLIYEELYKELPDVRRDRCRVAQERSASRPLLRAGIGASPGRWHAG